MDLNMGQAYALWEREREVRRLNALGEELVV